METLDNPSSLQKQPYLGDSINIATRSVHAKLNKSILAYLPLALPPQTHNPSLYVSGLLHIAPVYLAFESLWQDLLDSHEQTQPSAEDDEHPPNPERVHSILRALHLPGLMRAESLLSDIRALTGWTDAVVDHEINAVSQTGPLADFLTHIHHTINNHPPTLIAYAWILYMALFSGGRFIRATLESAGPAFWHAAGWW
ncbi:heme oxygenase-like protein [Trichocladium antarcticum]|uniref:Heme oxygenase-like protein n=1 Tax=Trichocladium antarcticum TaxID=1450529 RepID=A0AAN6ZG40_9PEZI|nr:heme oxygenase-like protein [Trichocladium antarcticum]